MTPEQFEVEIRAALERALLNPDYPKITTQEEADALARRPWDLWVRMMTDPREAVLLERGHGLDAIGARPEIDLPRNGIETDHDYRNRLIERMREPE